MEELSKEKCSSNVVERSLNRGDEATRDAIINEIVNAADLRSMLLDPVRRSGAGLTLSTPIMSFKRLSCLATPIREPA